MADYLISKVADAVEAKIVGGKVVAPAKPTLYEVVTLRKALDAENNEVIIRSQKINMTVQQVDSKISLLEIELNKLKAIRVEMV